MSSARSFLRGVIDYAGLFPPAQLGMSAAVNAYDEYRHSADKDLLGRFVVPAWKPLQKVATPGAAQPMKTPAAMARKIHRVR